MSAANWVHLGLSQGRGRMDRYTRRELPAKDIYVYPLHRRAGTVTSAIATSGQILSCLQFSVISAARRLTPTPYTANPRSRIPRTN